VTQTTPNTASTATKTDTIPMGSLRKMRARKIVAIGVQYVIVTASAAERYVNAVNRRAVATVPNVARS
jgi:hypothetical protein